MLMLAAPAEACRRTSGPRVISRSAHQRARRPFERRSLSRSRSFPTGIGPYASEFRRRCRLHSLANEIRRRLATPAAASHRNRVQPPVAAHALTTQHRAFPDKLHSSPRLTRCPQQTALWTSRAAAGSCDPKESRPPESCRGFVENATPAVLRPLLRSRHHARIQELRPRLREAP